jgi:hypothetical protein
LTHFDLFKLDSLALTSSNWIASVSESSDGAVLIAPDRFPEVAREPFFHLPADLTSSFFGGVSIYNVRM